MLPLQLPVFDRLPVRASRLRLILAPPMPLFLYFYTSVSNYASTSSRKGEAPLVVLPKEAPRQPTRERQPA